MGCGGDGEMGWETRAMGWEADVGRLMRQTQGDVGRQMCARGRQAHGEAANHASGFCLPFILFRSRDRDIATRQLSHRSSHAMPHKNFDDVEERERGERKRSLLRETTTS
jgi:hypothetical protein